VKDKKKKEFWEKRKKKKVEPLESPIVTP